MYIRDRRTKISCFWWFFQMRCTQPAIQCRLCKISFTNYYQLDEHLKAHAGASHGLSSVGSGILATSAAAGVKPLEFHCTHCAKQSLKQVFSSLHALEQHVHLVHSGKGGARWNTAVLCVLN